MKKALIVCAASAIGAIQKTLEDQGYDVVAYAAADGSRIEPPGKELEFVIRSYPVDAPATTIYKENRSYGSLKQQLRHERHIGHKPRGQRR